MDLLMAEIARQKKEALAVSGGKSYFKRAALQEKAEAEYRAKAQQQQQRQDEVRGRVPTVFRFRYSALPHPDLQR